MSPCSASTLHWTTLGTSKRGQLRVDGRGTSVDFRRPSGRGDAVCSLTVSPTAWVGEYFANAELEGAPVVRSDNTIDFDWLGDAPGVPGIGADNFSVRWTRTFNLTPGRYRCVLLSDEGIRIFVDRGGAGAVSFELEPVGWMGAYYANNDLSGLPARYRFDPEVNFDWSSSPPSPRMGRDNFSVRWTRRLELPVGRYRVTTSVDDGVRVFIDGRAVLDRWAPGSSVVDTVTVDLVGRAYDVCVEYFDKTSTAVCQVAFERLS